MKGTWWGGGETEGCLAGLGEGVREAYWDGEGMVGMGRGWGRLPLFDT